MPKAYVCKHTSVRLSNSQQSAINLLMADPSNGRSTQSDLIRYLLDLGLAVMTDRSLLNEVQNMMRYAPKESI